MEATSEGCYVITPEMMELLNLCPAASQKLCLSIKRNPQAKESCESLTL